MRPRFPLLGRRGRFSYLWYTDDMKQPRHRLFESYLEDHILVKYEGEFGDVSWTAHDQIGPDDMAHYFTCNGHEYILAWSDFPSDSFAHEEGTPVRTRDGRDQWVHVEGNDIYSGYYALYRVS